MQRTAAHNVKEAVRALQNELGRSPDQPQKVKDLVAQLSEQAETTDTTATGVGLTDAMSTIASIDSELVTSFLSVPATSTVQLDITDAPELKDLLTLDPERGVVLACSVLPTGCAEEAHGVDNAPASENVNNGTTSIPGLDLSQTKQPTCNTAAGQRIRVLYGYYTFSGAPGNRLSTYYNNIATMAAEMEDAVNASAVDQGGAKHVRFLMNSNCTLNVNAIAMPQAAFNADWNSVYSTITAVYKSTLTKYIVMLDNPGGGGCGQGVVTDDSRPDPALNTNNGHSTTIFVSDAVFGCWDDKSLFGTVNGRTYTGADVMMHELGHNMGAVQLAAPGSTYGWHCWDGKDRMCYDDKAKYAYKYSETTCTASAANRRYDCNQNTYFGRAPAAGSWLATHWNIYKSGSLY